MPRTRRRPTYFESTCLRDGTVLAAYPVRKPTPHIIKRDHLKIDDENVCREYSRSGREFGDGRNEGRFRFQDIIANSLNARRAIRSLVLPCINELESKLAALQSQLDRIEQAVFNDQSSE